MRVVFSKNESRFFQKWESFFPKMRVVYSKNESRFFLKMRVVFSKKWESFFSKFTKIWLPYSLQQRSRSDTLLSKFCPTMPWQLRVHGLQKLQRFQVSRYLQPKHQKQNETYIRNDSCSNRQFLWRQLRTKALWNLELFSRQRNLLPTHIHQKSDPCLRFRLGWFRLQQENPHSSYRL